MNDLRQRGRHYGHFGRVLEDGVAQTARLVIDRSLGEAAYELLTCRRLSLEGEGARWRCSLDLPPAGGKVILFVPQPIAALQLGVKRASRIKQGGTARVEAALRDPSGKKLPGVIPARLEVLRPDGSRDGFSHYTAFRRGELAFDYPVPANAPVGPWCVEVRDLAAGLRQATTFEVVSR